MNSPALSREAVSDFCPELKLALQLAQDATDAMAQADAQRKEASLQVRAAARRFLMDASADEDRISRASFIYWQMIEVPVNIIAAVLLGDEKKASSVAALLPKTGAGITCADCGVEIMFTSRSDLQIHRSLQRRGHLGLDALVCPECKELDRRERLQQYEVQAQEGQSRLQELRTMPYREYLFTEEWLSTRNRKLRQAHFLCQLCNKGGLLNVHHRTYVRRGCEDMADLTVLCHPCHAKFHDKLPAE